jgi:hypothetical protein
VCDDLISKEKRKGWTRRDLRTVRNIKTDSSTETASPPGGKKYKFKKQRKKKANFTHFPMYT